MDKATKVLVVLLILYALLSIAHLVFIPNPIKDQGPVELESTTTP